MEGEPGARSGDARDCQQAAPRRKVLDSAIVCSDGADFRETTRVAIGQFVQGAMAVEKIAFPNDFPGDSFGKGIHFYRGIFL